MRVFGTYFRKKNIFVLLQLLIVFTCIYAFSINFFEKASFDTMIKITASEKGSSNIVNVVIDEDSLKEISNWPWKRTLYADMFDYINLSGAKLILFDAVLTSQDKKNIADDEEFLKRIKNYNNIIAGVEFTKNENIKNSEEKMKNFSAAFKINVVDKRSLITRANTSYTAFAEMLNGYENAIKNIGAVNTTLDKDGKIRTFEPFILLNDSYYPSLPLAAYIKLNNVNKIILYENRYELIDENNKITKFPLQKRKDRNVQYIKWLLPFDNNSWVPHEQIKASDVIISYKNIKNGIAPVVKQEKFKDKIVVIGGTANALYDLKITPLSVNMPGSAIQATIVDNLLAEKKIQITNNTINILAMLLFMILIACVICFLPPILSIITILIIALGYFYIVYFGYKNGLVLNIITPYIFFVLTSIASYSYKFNIEDKKKEKLKRAMTKYINTTVVDDIIQNEDEVKLGGKKTELTVLMADIRGFTKLSENLDPNEVTKLLNEYFEQMIPIIESYKGAVNKFIGDAILAVFNEPIKDKNHPKNAIFCAMKMLSTTKELKKKWKASGKPDIDISIGINTGTAFIGNIGTPSHMEYTVIGDTVNVASRIEAQNRQFNTQILISESTYEYAKDMLDVIKISSVEIRGRKKHMDIYEIIKILNTNETN